MKLCSCGVMYPGFITQCFYCEADLGPSDYQELYNKAKANSNLVWPFCKSLIDDCITSYNALSKQIGERPDGQQVHRMVFSDIKPDLSLDIQLRNAINLIKLFHTLAGISSTKPQRRQINPNDI